jgi:hypothetical protein
MTSRTLEYIVGIVVVSGIIALLGLIIKAVWILLQGTP